jgi:hypothetical protein
MASLRVVIKKPPYAHAYEYSIVVQYEDGQVFYEQATHQLDSNNNYAEYWDAKFDNIVEGNYIVAFGPNGKPVIDRTRTVISVIGSGLTEINL